MKSGVTIGELANSLHINPKTIRYYEEVGLLTKPQRSNSGYRFYSKRDVERLRLVMRAKLLGLSLTEIKALVEYAIDGRCNDLEHRLFSLVEAKLNDIDRKIRDLTTFREELTHYKNDLSARLTSAAHRSQPLETDVSCSCIGKGVTNSAKKSVVLGLNFSGAQGR
ncbi:MAG: MerR family transcriptional regulator [Dehalococcoidia bacterium]|nr:MerR family transcriptional regulator [Dehalococcoidia bacterium]